MEEKEVTPEQFNLFFELFAARHPEIDAKLPPTRALINGNIYCNQPAKMPDDVYNIYFRFLRRWYMDNGFIPFDVDLVYVSTNAAKGMAIDTATIIDINPVTLDTASVTIQEKDSDIKETIIIQESADYFKNRVYIF